MSGTIKNDSALIAEFPVNGAGGIVPADMWDLIVSKLSIYPFIATATGTTQGGAAPLQNHFNIVTGGSAAANGVIVQATGYTRVWNALAVTINVYPPSGTKFDSLATNAPVQLAPGAAVDVAIPPTTPTQGYAR
jgi:hypothetical protein